MPKCVMSGFICCYSGCDIATCPPEVILCKGMGRFICCEGDCCAMNGMDPHPVGLIKEEGKICKLGLPCCTQSCFKPEPDNLIKFAWDCLCLDLKGQFPFGGDAPAPICAIYGAQCAQKDGEMVFACCNPAYTPGAFQFLEEMKQVKAGGPTTEEMAR